MIPPLLKLRGRVFLVVLLALAWPCRGGAAAYLDHRALAKELKELTRAHRELLHLEKSTETRAGHEVWKLELGSGSEEERKLRPAMLVVAGLEGNDLQGTSVLIAWVRSLAGAYPTNEPTRRLLDTTTLYVWPRLNPDGASHFFAKPRRETLTNDQPVDDDHDGLVDEDGPDDLDGDGLITSMRVEDPEGDYILDPSEPRLLVKADPIRGERGAWKLYSEGRDDDADKAWNEDGVGGVNFNRNFPYNYRFFAPGAGRHPVSELETRALADFVVEHPNIGIVFTFGGADNLVQTPKAEAPKRPAVALHEDDVGWYRELGKAWREALGLTKELSGTAEPGTFSDWLYFHRGRLSLAAKPWSPALQLALAKAKAERTEKGEKADKTEKTEKAEKAEPRPGEAKPAADPAKAGSNVAGAGAGADSGGSVPKAAEKTANKKSEPDTRNEEARAFLKWLDENAPEQFVAWKGFEHPDFAGRKVEIGGFAPFAWVLPPARLLPDLLAMEGNFLTTLAGKLPRIGVSKVEVKHLGESVYELSVRVENTGWLPTHLAQGELTREVLPTRVMLKIPEPLLLSGARSTVVGVLRGGEGRTVRWVVRAKAEKHLDVEVISALGGRVQRRLELNGGVP